MKKLLQLTAITIILVSATSCTSPYQSISPERSEIMNNMVKRHIKEGRYMYSPQYTPYSDSYRAVKYSQAVSRYHVSRSLLGH